MSIWQIESKFKEAWNPFNREPKDDSVPPEGFPFFLSPEGQPYVGGRGSDHFKLYNEVLKPLGVSTDDMYGWKTGRLFPEGLLAYDGKPLTPQEQETLMTAFQPHIDKTASLGIPAEYTPDDPYDIRGKQPLINAMQVKWWEMPPEQAKQVIVNAFRATMLSPRMNLKSNAILYQSLIDIPAEESDPDVFEQKIRQLKEKWDRDGQIGLGENPEDILRPEDQLPGRFMPGFWGNIRRLANLGPYINDLYEAAMSDIHQGGTGQIFRDLVLRLGIPGVGAKVASFAWLALAPNTSELATIDVHMMRHLNEPGDAPATTNKYFALENRLRQERDEIYGTDVPLAHYQWGVWDARRTPGYHQDHTPLKAYKPTPFQNISWPDIYRPPRAQAPMTLHPEQTQLFGKWQLRSMRGYPDRQEAFGTFVQDILSASGIQRLNADQNDFAFNWVREATQGLVPGYDRDPLNYRRSKDYRKSVEQLAAVFMKTDLAQQNQISTLDLRQDYVDQNYNGILPRQPDRRELQAKWILSSANIPTWSLVKVGGYTLQGKVVTDVGAQIAQGIVVRPDRQSREEIEEILNNTPSHAEDAQKQQEHFKQHYDWGYYDNPYVNRGGKVAQDFRPGPGGIGVTYSPSVIAVSEWVDVNDNWLLEHDRCRGIIAQKGGAASHGVVVARARNIAIVVDVPGLEKINPGDNVRMDSRSAIIYVNGGSTEEFGEAQTADTPIYRWIWSQGEGLSTPVPQDDPEAGVLHQQLIMQQYRAGQWDRKDNAMGVIYADGKVDMMGQPSDEGAMMQWLNSIHPVTTVEKDFSL